MEEEELVSSTEKEGVEVFFFPDESIVKQKEHEVMDTEHNADEECKSIDIEVQAQAAKPNAQIAKDLGDPTSAPKASPRKPKRKKVFSYFLV